MKLPARSLLVLLIQVQLFQYVFGSHRLRLTDAYLHLLEMKGTHILHFHGSLYQLEEIRPAVVLSSKVFEDVGTDIIDAFLRKHHHQVCL